jgi:curved DNA-binding protein CbpA
MSSFVDHYQVLGLSPQAEDVVIVAAYRALASRYHPDKFSGPDAELAHRRMAQINAAYAVLSDPSQRQAFDAQVAQADDVMARAYAAEEARARQQALALAQRLEREQAAREAQARAQNQREQTAVLENDWKTAVKLYPDLVALREQLNRADAGLALSFVRGMLTSGEFDSRKALADTLEKRYYQKTFGNHPQILALARELARLRLPKAMDALKNYLAMTGPAADPKLVVARIEREFNLTTLRGTTEDVDQESTLREQVRARRIARLQRDVAKFRNEAEARDLAQAMGYEVSDIANGPFKPRAVEVANRANGEVVAKLPDAPRFIEWVVNTLCRV